MLDHHVKGVVDRYVHHRCHAGRGLQWVIIGQPKVEYLDKENRKNLADILDYCRIAVPAEARGSIQAYRKWCGEAE